jgi:hypothetical protein
MDQPLGCTGSAALEQFILLSQSVEGAAAAGLITDVLDTPGIYVFGELLDMPNINNVSGSAVAVLLVFHHNTEDSCCICLNTGG